LSKRVLIEKEKEETRWTCTMAGMREYQMAEEGMANDVSTLTFNLHLAVGEGYRTLSWIWYSTTGDEITDNVSIGAYKYITYN
jgi:hypothetical protein